MVDGQILVADFLLAHQDVNSITAEARVAAKSLVARLP
jgi:hypothetical protein